MLVVGRAYLIPDLWSNSFRSMVVALASQVKFHAVGLAAIVL